MTLCCMFTALWPLAYSDTLPSTFYVHQAENVEHFEELTAFVKENDLGPYVTFMRSFR